MVSMGFTPAAMTAGLDMPAMMVGLPGAMLQLAPGQPARARGAEKTKAIGTVTLSPGARSKGPTDCRYWMSNGPDPRIKQICVATGSKLQASSPSAVLMLTDTTRQSWEIV